MLPEIKTHYCERLGKDVVFEKTKKLVGGFLIRCDYYSSSVNTYSRRFNITCSMDFPENKLCLLRIAMRKDVEEKSRLIKSRLNQEK
jgi:hypothetical protein